MKRAESRGPLVALWMRVVYFYNQQLRYVAYLLYSPIHIAEVRSSAAPLWGS
ncbi:hypothetical protein [Pyrobaculum aerophilum]|uniref:hypothetical protein n=1 Tax=Pyrobaculum aerophilum TaxID=13773 RepID=UPI00216306A2|nr:hypothetical protein [Pyrobaculum aerophilum]